ncbi:MAG: ROK family protein [Planctomycetota bacterium]|jgi:glucokinase|nr:ROK family protein [Planctomycetota bacterium]
MARKKGERLFGGIDIGGTKILAMIVNENGSVISMAKKKTKGASGFKSVCERAANALQEAADIEGLPLTSLSAVGIGVPVPVLADGTTTTAANLPGWANAPLIRTMETLTGRPCFGENDCNAGTYGEYVWGAGKNAKTLIGFFVGTGMGGGIVFHGRLIVGENRMGSEMGHVIVHEGGRVCSCGHKGCLEAYASKEGMARRLAWETMIEGRKSMLTQAAPDGNFSTIKSSILQEAYRKGDQVAVEALDELALYLGIGVANYINIFAPDLIVIGGGIFEALGKELLPRVKESARQRTFPAASFKDTKITLTQLGDYAVVVQAHKAAGVAHQVIVD